MGSATVPRLTAEVIGTAMLVFFGVASLVTSGGQAFIGAVAFLVTAAVAVWIFGGHFNPWITLATAIRGSVDWVGAGLIILAQLAGGIVGALLVWAVVGDKGVNDGLGVTRVAQGVNTFTAILAETLAVFLLCCVVFATGGGAARGGGVAGGGSNSGIGMGLAYAAGTLAIFAVTGASLNLARSLGPDVAMLFAADTPDWANFGRLWIYAVAGVLGAVLAALLYPLWKPTPRG